MTEPKRHFVETADGQRVEFRPEHDAALDFTDIDEFGESLAFDEHGNLLSGTPSEQA